MSSSSPRRATTRLDNKEKELFQAALVDFFRDGYHKNKKRVSDADILEYVNRFLVKNKILISGDFILKSIGVLPPDAPFNIDIYIPHTPHTEKIHRTLQDLSNIERDRAKVPKQVPRYEAPAKGGISSITTYELWKLVEQGGGGLAAAGGGGGGSLTASEKRKQAQEYWESAVMSGNLDLAIDSLSLGADPTQKIRVDGALLEPSIAILIGNPNADILEILLKRKVLIPKAYIQMVISQRLSDDQIIELLTVVVRNSAAVDANAVMDPTDPEEPKPLQIALMKNYPRTTAYLLSVGAKYHARSTYGETILEATKAGKFGADASAVLIEHVAGLGVAGKKIHPESYYAFFIAEEDKRTQLHKAAVKLWDANPTPICNTEGAYQHRGECWNDTAYMIITYADGIKEHVQPALLKGNLESMATVFNDGSETGQMRTGQMHTYLQAMRSRFVRHYMNQRETEEQCAIDIAAAIRKGGGTYRGRGINSQLSAVMGSAPTYIAKALTPYNITRVTYIPGYFPNAMITDLITVFGLSPYIKQKNIHTEFTSGMPNLYRPNDAVKTLAGIALIILPVLRSAPPDHHATCFYTCGGVEYYFDNNLGVFQYPWRKLFAKGGSIVILTVPHGSLPYKYFPGFFFKSENRLVVLALDAKEGARYHVLSWDGNMKESAVWPSVRIKYSPGAHVSDATQLMYTGADMPVVPQIKPSVVGRSTYRRPYASHSSSSERKAIGTRKRLAARNMTPVKATMRIIQGDNPQQIIRNIDLTFCQNWYDGENLWMMDKEAVYKRSPGLLMPRYVAEFKTGNHDLRERIQKYISQGFGVQYKDPDTGTMVEVH